MKFSVALFLLFAICNCAISQTTIAGKVTDQATGEELIGANLQLMKAGVFIVGTSTDFNGNYTISLDPGKYDVIISYIGLTDKKINGVLVQGDKTNKLNIKLDCNDSHNICGGYYITTSYKIPLIDKDNTTSQQVLNSIQIKRNPLKQIKDLATTISF